MTARRRSADRLRNAQAYFAVSADIRLARERAAEEVLGFNRLGVNLAASGHHIKAQEAFDGALRLCPTFGEGWFHRGLMCQQLGDWAGAYEAYAQAAMLTPNYTAALEKLAVVAPQALRPAAILTPWRPLPVPSAAANLGHKLRKLVGIPDREDFMPDDPDEEVLRRDLLNDPTASHSAMKLGRVLVRQRRFTEAEHFLRYALDLRPWDGHAAMWLCFLLAMNNRAYEAPLVANRAFRAGANAYGLVATASWNALQECDWSTFRRLNGRLTNILRADPELIVPFAALHYVDDPMLHLACAKATNLVSTAGCKPLKLPAATGRGFLTLGYVSAEFNGHAVASLMAELFELHDRSRFKIHGYSLWRGRQSDLGERMKAGCDKFTELGEASHGALAQKIANDGVDILIDVSGLTEHGQPRIIAHRPAPVQVNYLGYPGTSGADEVDYVVVDKILAPSAHERFFTEALVRMPHSYQVNDRKRVPCARVLTRQSYGLPTESVVFCAFNDARKILPECFARFIRIAQRVPDSLIWFVLSNAAAIDNLREEARKLGMDTQRLIFAPRLAHDEHIARYAVADLFLDTHPYNAHTTASDALWMGCPVVTMLGQSFQSRVAASLLHAVGLPELVTHSAADYEELAVRIGLDGGLRDALKAKLRIARDICPLFDTPRYVRHLEWAFEEMWRRHLAGERPAAFDVPSL